VRAGARPAFHSSYAVRALEALAAGRSTRALDVVVSHMPIFNLYVSLSLWFRKHLIAIIGVTLLSSAVGLGTERFVGGRTAEVAGRVQLIFLVAYFLLTFIFFIFRPYQGRVGTFLRTIPMQCLAVLVGSVILVIALFMIGFTLHSIVHDDI
jgi:arginine exporter protein ArgO